MKTIRKIYNFESFIKATCIMMCLVHFAYCIIFYITKLEFLIPITLIRLILMLLFSYYVVIKNALFKFATLYIHFDMAIFSAYYSYILGLGYGFNMIIVVIISFAYLQNFNNPTVPLAIGITEVIIFYLTYYIAKDIADYPNDFMHYINVMNFLCVTFASFLYIYITDKNNSMLLKKLESEKTQATKKAQIDYLTKLYNRRAMNEIIDEKINKLQNKQINSVSIAICDLDDFKSLNDTYGHDFGDLVLKEVSSLLNDESSKNNDIFVSRWGGEEFLILLINHSYEETHKKLENIRILVENLKLNNNSKNIKISISIGFIYTNNNYDKNCLYQNADNALYKAKKLGKNQVQCLKIG